MAEQKTDIINQRVDAAQAELQKRAARLTSLVNRAKGKNIPGFKEGVDHTRDMIEGQSKLCDTLVFDAPRTRLEQMRNLQLMTGNMNERVQQGIKATTDAIDGMLDTLTTMVEKAR